MDARAAILRDLEALVLADPKLLVVEDLHWADPTTIELLGRIATRLPAVAVLCVATYRPEFQPPWPAAHTIELHRLSPEDVRAMVLAWGAEADLSAAGGVPLFVEAMLKAGVESADVPPTLQGLLTQRLEQLPGLGDVIDMAAVLGRDFDRDLLAALTPLDGALGRLTEQDVIRPVASAPSRLEFSHALLQEAAYSRLLRRRRHALHARVAEALTTGDREPELVAEHWMRAGRPQEAVPHWLAAGERALRRAAFPEAADHFRHGLEALEAAPEAGDRGEFLTRLAVSLQAGIGYAAPGADEAYAEARRTAPADRLPVIVRGQWSYHLLRADYDTALAFADETLALGRLADGHVHRGMVHMYRGEFVLARTHLTEAYAHYEPQQHSGRDAEGDIGVAALAYLSSVLWNLGEADEAQARSDLSLELADRVGGPVAKAQAWGMRSLLHLARLEVDQFAEWVERTRAHSDEHNVGYWRLLSTLLEGWLRRDLAQVDASLDAYRRSGATLGMSRFQLLRADLCLAAGDQAGALAALEASERHIAQTGERYSEADLYRFKARLDPEHAPALLERAIDIARAQGAVLFERRAATQLADLVGAR